MPFFELLGDGVRIAQFVSIGPMNTRDHGPVIARGQRAVVNVDVILVAEAALQDQRPRIDHALGTRAVWRRLRITGAPSIGTRIAGE